MKNMCKKMRLFSVTVTLFIILFAFLVNLSCGGGGGGGSDSITNPTTTPTQTGNVSGTVYDVDGNPLEGATVSWDSYQLSLEKQALSTVTDSNGNFFLSNIPVGNIIITAVKENYAICRQVSVNSGQTTSDAFHVEPVGSLEGHVYDSSSNSPISGALLKITIDSWNVILQTKTDSTGKYYYPCISLGSHSITVSSQGYSSQTTQVTISTGETTEADFKLAPSSSPTPAPTVTISPVPTATPTSSPTITPTASPTASPTPTPSPTNSPTPPVASGRFIVFECAASNLVEGDNNCNYDIFIYDQQTGIVKRVSTRSGGSEANGNSGNPCISTDSRYVAFHSYATNLTDNDNNNKMDVFIHDRQTDETTLVSRTSSGSVSNENSYEPSLSDDGRYVAFHSHSSDLVAGDNNNNFDVFVLDRQTNQITRVSVSSSGTEGNLCSDKAKISGNGRYVVFKSTANNLVSGDTNVEDDIFLHDRQTHQTIRVSVSSNGEQANDDCNGASISQDGRFIVFSSSASSLVSGDVNNMGDVFIYNRDTAELSLVSIAYNGLQGNNSSGSPSVSRDGRYVSFHSYATNMVENDNNGRSDIFVRDRQAGQTTRVSVSSSGQESDWNQHISILSLDGRYVVFQSYSPILVEGDTNGCSDIFVHDRQTSTTKRISVNSDGSESNANSEFFDIK